MTLMIRGNMERMFKKTKEDIAYTTVWRQGDILLLKFKIF